MRNAADILPECSAARFKFKSVGAKEHGSTKGKQNSNGQDNMPVSKIALIAGRCKRISSIWHVSSTSKSVKSPDVLDVKQPLARTRHHASQESIALLAVGLDVEANTIHNGSSTVPREGVLFLQGVG